MFRFLFLIIFVFFSYIDFHASIQLKKFKGDMYLLKFLIISIVVFHTMHAANTNKR